MPSSTSSSELPGVDPSVGDSVSAAHALTLLTGIATVLVLLVAYWRPDLRNPADDSSFFRMKLAWRDVADVVVLGNSQVYRGLDPQAFAETCPGVKVLNFGFSGAQLRPRYVEASLQVLRRDGPRVLLVGINPLQFRSGPWSDGFIDTERHDAQFRLPWQFESALQPVLRRLRPLEMPMPDARLVSWDYRRDGFVASNSPVMPIKSSRYARYANDYVVKPYSEEIYQGLLEQLQALRRNGYRVLVFSTYSSPAFELIDARMSGLDDSRLARDLRARGLDYLAVPVAGLRSYDGTHLDAPSAAIFSRRIGDAVKLASGTPICRAGPAP